MVEVILRSCILPEEEINVLERLLTKGVADS